MIDLGFPTPPEKGSEDNISLAAIISNGLEKCGDFCGHEGTTRGTHDLHAG